MLIRLLFPDSTLLFFSLVLLLLEPWFTYIMTLSFISNDLMEPQFVFLSVPGQPYLGEHISPTANPAPAPTSSTVSGMRAMYNTLTLSTTS